MLAAACLFACACAAAPASPVARVAPGPSGCREDIPDCVAACALRETSRTDFVEWFDRRCAATILGHDPDRSVADAAPPERVQDLLDTR